MVQPIAGGRPADASGGREPVAERFAAGVFAVIHVGWTESFFADGVFESRGLGAARLALRRMGWKQLFTGWIVPEREWVPAQQRFGTAQFGGHNQARDYGQGQCFCS